MWRWVSIFCSKCQVFTTFDGFAESSGNQQMIPKIVLFTFFGFSLSFALILALLPNLATLWWTTRQFGATPPTGFSQFTSSSLSKTEYNFIKHDLCLRNFAKTLPLVDEGDVVADSETTVVSSSLKSTDSNSKHSTSDLAGEAVAALHLARDMMAHGKKEKASKIFQHAVSLSPNNPDVLTEYGEFLEKFEEDVIKAEHLYCKALITSPSHSKALVNRQRTLPLVEEIDQTYFNVLDNKRKILLGIPENHPGVRRMMQESYYKHIYHTTAIEGNSFTLSQTRMLVENRLAIGGKSVMEHNEILGMDAAFTFVNNSLSNRLGSLTEKDIKNIQKRVLGFVDPIGAGEYRTTQVFVGDYQPPDASEVGRLMAEFILWLNSEETLSLHPIELAALAHYRFVWIHPFYDGNGRTSRLLMNLILMQAGFPPIIIEVEEKHVYYQHLETANNGDIRPFIRFLARCTERALDEYLLAGVENARSLISNLRVKAKYDGRTIVMEEYIDQNVEP